VRFVRRLHLGAKGDGRSQVIVYVCVLCSCVRVRVLLKATLSRIRQQCAETSSRRKRNAHEEKLQYLKKEYISQALDAGKNDIEQVFVGSFITHACRLCCFAHKHFS